MHNTVKSNLFLSILAFVQVLLCWRLSHLELELHCQMDKLVLNSLLRNSVGKMTIRWSCAILHHCFMLVVAFWSFFSPSTDSWFSTCCPSMSYGSVFANRVIAHWWVTTQFLVDLGPATVRNCFQVMSALNPWHRLHCITPQNVFCKASWGITQHDMANDAYCRLSQRGSSFWFLSQIAL